MMDKFLFIILILLSFATSAATPESCSPVDLRGPKLGPVRNQDSMGWCFAFGAADLLSYRLGQKISAADLAHERSKGLIEKLIERIRPEDQFKTIKSGYYAEDAIKETQHRGWCLEKDVPSEDNKFGNYYELFTKISELKQKMQAGQTFKEDEACSILKSAFPGIGEREALKILSEASIQGYYTELINKSCSKRIHDRGLKLKETSMTAGSLKILREINEQLNKKNVIGFNYHADMYKDPKSRSISSNHSSLIVARRFNSSTRSCEFLVRNSWGRSCGYYHESLSCEEGHIWMPQSSLLSNTTGIYYAN